MDIFSSLEPVLLRYGLAGIFAISLISNSIPYSTIPYLFFIAVYAGLISEPAHKLLIVAFASLGASIGKVIVYLIGYSFRRVISSSAKESLERFARSFAKSTFAAILLFASLPLPDDVIYVPLGIAKYDVVKYFAALLIGKTIITSVAVYYGSLAAGLFTQYAEIPLYVSIPALVLVTLYLSYLVVSIDWLSCMRLLRESGVVAFVKGLLREVHASTIRLFRRAK